MRKLLLMGILLGTFVIPIMAARSPDPRRALRQVRKRFAWFVVLWIFAILYIMPRL
jgi:hypothetical protein